MRSAGRNECMRWKWGPRTKKSSSNQNVRSEHFERLSYLLINICICIPLHTQTGYVISVFTYTVQTEREWQANITTWLILYYKVFSPVNDTWCIVVMFCLVVWSVCVYAFRGCGFRWWFAGRVGRTLSVLSG